MKKLFLCLILVVECVGYIMAEYPIQSQLIGRWVLSGNKDTTIRRASGGSFKIDKQKMLFTKDNRLLRTFHSKDRVMVANDGEYALFSEGKLVIFQKSNDGIDMGLANTFRVTIKGDSMHIRGFILQPSPINGKENPYKLRELLDNNTPLSIGSTLIDEWWIFEPIPIDPNALQIPERQLNFSTKQTSY